MLVPTASHTPLSVGLLTALHWFIEFIDAPSFVGSLLPIVTAEALQFPILGTGRAVSEDVTVVTVTGAAPVRLPATQSLPCRV